MLFRSNDHIAGGDLNAYLDVRLSGSALERCEAHLDGCSACREALDGLGAVQASLRSLPRATAPRSFRLREADVGVARPKVPWTVPAVPLLSGLSAASVVAFVVMVGVSAGGGIDLDSSNGDSAAGPALMSAEADGAATREEIPRAYESALPQQGIAATDEFSEAPDAGSLAERSAEGPPSETPSANAYTAFRNTPATQDDGEDLADASDGRVEEPVPGKAGESASDNDDDGDRTWYVAQAIVAAIALGSGGFAFAAWRRTR